MTRQLGLSAYLRICTVLALCVGGKANLLAAQAAPKDLYKCKMCGRDLGDNCCCMDKKSVEQQCGEAKRWILSHTKVYSEKVVEEMTCSHAQSVARNRGWKSQDDLAADARREREELQFEQRLKAERDRADAERAKWAAKWKAERDRAEAERTNAAAKRKPDNDTGPVDQARQPEPEDRANPTEAQPKPKPRVREPEAVEEQVDNSADAREVIRQAEQMDQTLTRGVRPEPVPTKSDREIELEKQIRQKAQEMFERSLKLPADSDTPPGAALPPPDAAATRIPGGKSEGSTPPIALDGLDGLIADADSRNARRDEQRQQLVDRKIADTAEIQRNHDPNSPPPVQFSGATSQEMLSKVSAGEAGPGDSLVFKPVGAMERQLPIKVMREVTFAPDRSVKYVQEDIVYRVVGESGYHAFRRVTPFPISPEQRGTDSDREFISRQTVFIRTDQARAFHPTQGINDGGPAAETAVGKVAEASKLGLDSLDHLAGHSYSAGKWLSPWSDKWEQFPSSLSAAGYEPGPGTLQPKDGVKVYIGNSVVPGEWWGDDWAKKRD